MKKTFFLTLLTAALLGLSAVSASATSPQAPCGSTGDPNNPGVWEMMKNHADTMRVRDNAYTRQILDSSYPTPYTQRTSSPGINLACLDKALGLTAMLSNLFSGLAWGSFNITPHNHVFCGILAFPDIPPTISLSGHLKNFLGNFMNLNFLPAIQIRYCTPPLTITTPHLSLGGSLGGCLPNINLGGTIPLIKPICVGISTPGMSCNLISGLWKGSSTSTEGRGVMAGTPYLNLQNLVKGSSNVPAMGQNFLHQMDNNSNILTNAMNNLVRLHEPGHIVSWPTTPNFSANSNTMDIINGM